MSRDFCDCDKITNGSFLVDSEVLLGTVNFDVALIKGYLLNCDNSNKVLCKGRFWLTHAPSTILEVDFPLKTQPEGVGVNVYIDGVCAGVIRARSPCAPSCVHCRFPVVFPFMGMSFLASGESDGWVLLGTAAFSLLNPCETVLIRNLAIEEYISVAESECITVGMVGNISSSFCKSHASFSTCEHVIKPAVAKEFQTIYTEEKFRNFKVRHPRFFQFFRANVAKHHVFIPRPLYYHESFKRVGVTYDWIEAQLLYSLFLSGKSNDSLSKFVASVEWNVAKVPTGWERFMCIIIRAFCMFSTKFQYIPDNICMPGGKELVSDQYSGEEVTLNGSSDCEDLAWFLFAIYQKISMYQGQSTVINACKAMLDCYVVCNSSVTSLRAKLSLPAGWSEDEETRTERPFHITVLLFPKTLFVECLEKGIGEKTHIEPKLLYSAIGRDCAFNKLLKRLYSEGTGNVFPDPWEKVKGVDWNQVQENADKSILNIPTENNGPAYFSPYFEVVALNSDFLMKNADFLPKSCQITTEVTVSNNGIIPMKIRDLEHGCGAAFTPTRDIRYLLSDAELLTQRRMEPPPAILNINLNEFVELLEKERKKKYVPPDGIWWNAYFTDSFTQIEYLPWSATSKQVKPVYIQSF